MNGKILLDYWKKEYDRIYPENLFSVFGKNWYVIRDAIGKTLYLLKNAGDITQEEYLSMMNLLHSQDSENWTVIESIIEQINTTNTLTLDLYGNT